MRLHVRFERVDRIQVADRIHLRRRDDLRLRRKLGAERRELALDGLEVLDRIASGCARDIDEMHQHLGAIEMLQKPIAEPLAFVRPFDEPGHVGDDEAAIAAQRHDAEIRGERRERIVGDLRPRGGNARDQRRLAGVGKADEADVGEQLQMKLQLFGLARQCLPRSAAARGWSS